MKSTHAKAHETPKDWYLIDLKDKILGRAATRVAHVLRGKHKPAYTPGVDMGDFVIAINAGQVRLTGRKWEDKRYYRHSNYMGGLKEITAAKLAAKDPTALFTKAVRGMLPRGPLGRRQLKKLKVYAGTEHPHTAQGPKEIKV